MPTMSSIYWIPIDGSERSASGESSGDVYSSGSGRHYVDPWDLENYAYMRRHSTTTQATTSKSGRRWSDFDNPLSRNSRVNQQCRQQYQPLVSSNLDYKKPDRNYCYPVKRRPSGAAKPEELSYVEVTPPPHLDLNTYGHLKIDYSNSWNSLHRKIKK